MVHLHGDSHENAVNNAVVMEKVSEMDLKTLLLRTVGAGTIKFLLN